MNPTEQRQRHDRLNEAFARIEALELLVAQLLMNDNILLPDNERHKVNIANAIRRCDERQVTT